MSQIKIEYLSPVVMRNDRLLRDRATTMFYQNTAGCISCVYKDIASQFYCREKLNITKKGDYKCLVTCTRYQPVVIKKPVVLPKNATTMTTKDKMDFLLRDMNDKQ